MKLAKNAQFSELTNSNFAESKKKLIPLVVGLTLHV